MSRSRGAVLLARQSRSQDEIAEKVGVSRVAVSKWLNGNAKPTKDKRGDLTEAYDIPAASWDEDEKASSPSIAAPLTGVPVGVLPKAAMLEKMVADLMADIQADPDATPLEKSKVMRNCSATLRELGGITDIWNRYERAILSALKPFPSAADAVLKAIARASEETTT